MKKWEYLVRTNLDNGKLDLLGKQGWELVTMIFQDVSIIGGRNTYIFKKELGQERKEPSL